MSRISVLLFGLGSVLTAGIALGHEMETQYVSPPPLNNESIIARLNALGFSDVVITGEQGSSVDVEMSRSGTRYRLTTSRSIVGPGSLAAYDTAQFVEGAMKAVGSRPQGDSVPKTPPSAISPR
jgi:hypothetical protein